MTNRQFQNLLPTLEIVDLTSNVCIKDKFSGKTEIQRMILGINASCNYERQIGNSNEVLCEETHGSEFGIISCYIGFDTEISSQSYKLTSMDYHRIQSLVIKDYKGYYRLKKIRYLPVVNRFIRNLIEYDVRNAAVSVIGKENFVGMIWLERLDIAETLIETIPSDTFQGLIRLEYVYLGERFNYLQNLKIQI